MQSEQPLMRLAEADKQIRKLQLLMRLAEAD